MVQKSHGNSGKVLTNEWHAKRWEAESETFGIEEWDEIDVEKYDLDEIGFTRKYKESSFKTETRKESEGSAKEGVDIRTLDTV